MNFIKICYAVFVSVLCEETPHTQTDRQTDVGMLRQALLQRFVVNASKYVFRSCDTELST